MCRVARSPRGVCCTDHLLQFWGAVGQLEEGKVGSLRQKGKCVGGNSVTLALFEAEYIYIYICREKLKFITSDIKK